MRCLQCSEECLVTGSWDTQCIVWDIVQSLPLAVLSGHTSCVSCIDMDSGRMYVRLSVCLYSEQLQVWFVWLFVTTPPSPPLRCRVTGSYDCTVRVWHASLWHCMHVIHAHNGERPH